VPRGRNCGVDAAAARKKSMPYHTTPWQFHDIVVLLCPQCLGQAIGHIIFQDGKVWFDKRSPRHGLQRV
jgi:hypothetical protein